MVLTAAGALSCGAGQGATSPAADPPGTTVATTVGSTGVTTSTTVAGRSGVQPVGTFAVGLARRTFVDSTRPTAAHGGVAEKPSRTLPAIVVYPAAGGPASATAPKAIDDAAAQPGPWPLIVFSHGSTRRGIHYVDTLTAWASAGYVVVAPDYPLSSEGVPGGTDYQGAPEQARDVSFLIDEVTRLAGTGDAVLAGLVDVEHIGLGGQSFGAITSVLAGYNTCCAEDRVDAVVVFAGAGLATPESGLLDPASSARALLWVHGDADGTLPYAGAHAAWAQLPAPRWFLTLAGGGHDDGFFGGLTSPEDRVVTLASVGFLDQQLKGDATGLNRSREAVDAAGATVAKLEAA